MSSQLFDLSGRVAVVMGGTSGIGRAISLGLTESGADVVATGRRENNVAEVAGEIEARGKRSLRMTVDASNRSSIDALRDAVLKEHGRVDILVNSAGQIFRKPTINITEQEWNNLVCRLLLEKKNTVKRFYEP